MIPVWNKSNREHTIIGSKPMSVRHAADAAVGKLGWRKPYFCDADHINFETVDRFLDACDFYTIDVADWIGKPADATAFVEKHPELMGELTDSRRRASLHTTKEFVGAGRGEISDGGDGGGPDLSQDRSGERRGNFRDRSFDG